MSVINTLGINIILKELQSCEGEKYLKLLIYATDDINSNIPFFIKI